MRIAWRIRSTRGAVGEKQAGGREEEGEWESGKKRGGEGGEREIEGETEAGREAEREEERACVCGGNLLCVVLLLLEGVYWYSFSNQYRMCSLATECVRLPSVRCAAVVGECVLLLQNVFSC